MTLEILISSSVLILILALLRLLLRGRIDPRLQYAMWLLVLLRLLVPVSFFHSPVSAAEAAAPAVERIGSYAGQVLWMQGAPRSAAVSEAPEAPSAGDALAVKADAGRPLLLRDALRYIRYGGTAVMGLWFLFVNLRLSRQLRRTRTPYGSDGRLPVYVAEGIPSPCLFGLVRPAVYLTEQAAADPLQARQIVVHERTHHRHGDLFWALLRCVCLAAWWFDPFVWLAAVLSRRDCELACDAGTIRALGEAARYDYGRTLVGMTRVGPARPADLLCSATTMKTGKRSLRERISRITQKPRTSLLAAVLALLVTAAAVGFTYAGAAEENDAAEAALSIPEATVKAPLFEDGQYLYPDLYEVELRDITIASDGMTFSAEAAPEEYGFDFRAWLRDGTSIPTGRVTWDGDAYEETGRTNYTVEWAAPLDLGELARIDHYGDPLPLPGAMEMIPSLELWDYFTDYLENGTTAADFDTWAAYVYFPNDYAREMARENYQPFGPGAIYNAEQVNDDLAAFLVWFEPERFPSLQYVGRYEERLYVFRNRELVPEELRPYLDLLTLQDPAESSEDIMVPDYDYLEEVDRELAGFAQPREVQVILSPDYVPEVQDPWNLEDLIYCTDAWQFQYRGEVPANDPEAVILIRDADDRTLFIQEDTDALLIEEADGSHTWVTLPGGDLTGAAMIGHLLAWAESFSDPEAQAAALRDRQVEAERQLLESLGELGYYSLPGQEPVYSHGGDEYPIWIEGEVYPITAERADPADPHGPTVFLAYSMEDAWGADLQYHRLYAYADGERLDSITAEELPRLIEYYGAFTQVTPVTVGGNDGIITLVDNHAPELIWYDAENDLLFSLFVRGRDLTDQELIALGETVGPAETAPPGQGSAATYLSITYEGRAIDSFLEAAGTQIQLAAEVIPPTWDGAVTWSSTDEAVAAVDSTGLVTVTGKSGGVCEIVAQAGTLEARCTVYAR